MKKLTKAFLVISLLLMVTVAWADPYQGHARGISAPISSTDNAIARFDGTGGTVLQNSGVIIDDSNRIGLGTSVPTHTVTHASTSTGTALYNTADQVTNYERVTHGWASNVATISVERGGSGTARGFQLLTDNSTRGISFDAAASILRILGTTTSQATLRAGSSNTGLRLQGLVTTLVNVPVVQLDSTNLLSASSATQIVAGVVATMSQTGTAAYKGLQVNITETSTGSGQKDLLSLEVGSAQKLRVDNTGAMDVDSTITAGGTTGNRTIDKPCGTVNIAAAGTAVTVTNSLVTASSIMSVLARTNDSTCAVKNYVPGAGTVTVNMTAACDAETSIGFCIIDKN